LLGLGSNPNLIIKLIERIGSGSKPGARPEKGISFFYLVGAECCFPWCGIQTIFFLFSENKYYVAISFHIGRDAEPQVSAKAFWGG
jgi:hypothetical protein